MMHFRQTVLSHIQSASDEREIENIICDSIQRLKSRNIHGHIIQRFIQAMGKTLDQARLEDMSEKDGTESGYRHRYVPETSTTISSTRAKNGRIIHVAVVLIKKTRAGIYEAT